MFRLNRKINSIRIGEILVNNKHAETPCFFATSDFGGGGTNVSRLLVYSDLFKESKSQLLMNYYYLDINSDLSPRFDTTTIKKLQSFKNINEFIQFVKKEYAESNPKKIINGYKIDTKNGWNPLILLDSGSGNILREKIKKKELTHSNYKTEYNKLISEYFDFAISNKFDILIAIDFAAKNTLKAGEMKDKDYVNGIIEFSSNERNLELLKLTLEYMKKIKSHIDVLSPIHGNSPMEYKNYIENILHIEKEEGIKFSGFAIGGLGNPNKINRELWGISDKCNGRVKAALYLMKVTSIVRNVLNKHNDERPIHILGSASPYNLIPLIVSGCDTYDCHSAWRRASDGNEVSKECVFSSDKLEEYLDEGVVVSFPKMLVPLLNSKLEVIPNNKNYLEFENLNTYSSKCDCSVCHSISLLSLKKLYCGNKEQNYYAKILIYLHNVLQYDYISNKFKKIKDYEEFNKFIIGLEDSMFKDNMKQILFQ
ncbi:hypothetical protein KKC87_04040 [Patescibacteria group bacterium]|nr:hypothetical protein [Patescibacteria group bacterium]